MEIDTRPRRYWGIGVELAKWFTGGAVFCKCCCIWEGNQQVVLRSQKQEQALTNVDCSALTSSLPQDRSVVVAQTEHWDRFKIYFLMLQFSIDVFCFICFLSSLHSQGRLIWELLIVQVWVTSPIYSEAWLQFGYRTGLNCVVWQGVPHINHSDFCFSAFHPSRDCKCKFSQHCVKCLFPEQHIPMLDPFKFTFLNNLFGGKQSVVCSSPFPKSKLILSDFALHYYL